MKINFKYTAKQEVKEVIQCLKDANFLTANRYDCALPAGVFLNSKLSKIDLEQKIAKEYQDNMYAYFKLKEELSKDLENVINEYQNFFINKDFLLPDKIDINFSFYGTKGSYDLPDQISVRLVNDMKGDLLPVVLHEITHIIIEKPLVLKFALDHSTKENLVDWILSETELHHILPNYKVQTNYSLPDSAFRKIFY